MKIINRIIQIEIKVNIKDKDNKQYTMVKRYIFFYIISLILFVNAGVISIVLIVLPFWFNANVKWIITGLIIVNLIPILIFGIIPKKRKYIKIEKEI